MMDRTMKSLALAAVFGLAAVVFAGTAHAAHIWRGGPLLVINSDVKLSVSSDASGVNTAVLEDGGDGMTYVYEGVGQIRLSGDGSFDVSLNTTGIAVEMGKGALAPSGSVNVNILVDTPVGAEVVDLDFFFRTGTQSDSVKIEAVNNAATAFNMKTNFDLETRSGTVSALIENTGPAPANLVFEGRGGTRDDTFELIGKGGGLFTLAGKIFVEQSKIEIEGDLEAGMALIDEGLGITLVGEDLESESEVIVKGDLCGELKFVNMRKGAKLEVAGQSLPSGGCSAP